VIAAEEFPDRNVMVDEKNAVCSFLACDPYIFQDLCSVLGMDHDKQDGLPCKDFLESGHVVLRNIRLKNRYCSEV
jgi:hypothetical protein